MTDGTIDTSEIPPLDEGFFRRARLRMPQPERAEVTLHLDSDLVTWFRAKGASYEGLINAALRIYVEAHRDVR